MIDIASSYYYSPSSSSSKFILLALLLVSVALYVVYTTPELKSKFSAITSDIDISISEDKPEPVISTIEIRSRQTNYSFSRQELEVALYGNIIRTEIINSSGKLSYKNYTEWSLIEKKQLTNLGTVSFNLKTLTLYNISISEVYSARKIYPEATNIAFTKNITSRTVYVDERGTLRPLVLYGDQGATVSSKERYIWRFELGVVGNGIIKCPYIEVKTNSSDLGDIYLWLKVSNGIVVPSDKLKYNTKYQLSTSINRDNYASVMMQVERTKKGKFELMISDCYDLEKTSIQIEFL